GAVLNSYSYLPFGEPLQTSETVSNAFTYGGQLGVMREGNGLDYMRNRWYDVAQGRFTQEDPIGLASGANFYAYVGNNPVSFADPSGLTPIAVVLGGEVFLGEYSVAGGVALVDTAAGAAVAGQIGLTPAEVAFFVGGGSRVASEAASTVSWGNLSANP